MIYNNSNVMLMCRVYLYGNQQPMFFSLGYDGKPIWSCNPDKALQMLPDQARLLERRFLTKNTYSYYYRAFPLTSIPALLDTLNL